jgi:VWFA-related protein
VNFQRITSIAALLTLASMMIPAANAQAPADSGAVIRTETKVVLVDAVVTDKKGNYIQDLDSKDFKVYEDNKEQHITSFSFESGPATPSNLQKHYLVLFFDNSTMDFGDQSRARQAAVQFIDANAGPNRLMSIVNFGGALQVAQNFTADAQRLKNVVSGVKFSAVDPNASDASAPQISAQTASFGARDVLYALKDLAKGLSSVPGRKTLVLITAGFPLTEEIMSEATAVISACNKSNVAIYPIDVRGLVAGTPKAQLTAPDSGARFLLTSYHPGGLAFFMPQHGPTGGGGHPGGGGGPVGGGAGGGRGPTGGGGNPGGGRGPTAGPSPGRGTSNTGPAPARNPFGNNAPWANPNNQARMIIPQLPGSTTENQNIMFMLAGGTGGFVIHETNDLIGGMNKIGKEQDEYYLLGYTPPDSAEGSCHTLKVKVDHGGTEVRARTGYCNSKPQDLLAGDPEEKTLEARAASAQAGDVKASMELPFFYTSPNIARVNVAMEIATGDLKFEKHKGKYHAAMNILGLAYLPNGAVGARFSDTINLDFDEKKEMEAFKEHPMHYENQFDVASGKYNLKVVFASGNQSFGKLEMPLVVDPYDEKQFSMSGIALSKEVRKAADLGTGLDALLLEDRVPLIADDVQVVPYGDDRFTKKELAAFYIELYEPLLADTARPKPPVMAFEMRILDGKTGEQKVDSGLIRVTSRTQTGNPRVPLAAKIPTDTLAPGDYKLEVKILDDTGKQFMRTTNIQVD